MGMSFDIMSATPGCRIIAGSVTDTGTGAGSVTSSTGQGYSVTRTDTGRYTFTLDSCYNKYISIVPSLSVSSVVDGFVQLVAKSASAGTFEIDYLTGGSDTTPDNLGGRSIHFICIAGASINS